MSYRLEVEPKGLYARLSSPGGDPWLRISLLSAFDKTDGVDETLAVEVREDGDTIEVERRSTIWGRAGTTIVRKDDTLEVRAWVEGEGVLADVHLLGGRPLLAGAPTGFSSTGHAFETLFSPNPGDPAKLTRGAGESAVIGVAGDGTPGRGHWFFTPAPLFFALDSLGFGLAAPVDELRFVQAEYRPGDKAFHLVLDYDGHTHVDGRFDAPAIVLRPGLEDPYQGIRRHRDDLVEHGFVPKRAVVEADWWSEPMFCGWGAQCYLASQNGRGAPAQATQQNYDGFLTALEAHGIVPGTVVIDDKWQDSYGTNAPDTAKWPDLTGWIAERHAREQRVLLWWKAWDPEGLPPELCICTPDGVPIAMDPTNPAARELLRAQMWQMLSPDGLDADGLKVDFTARTPSGRALTAHGDGWGIALLHDLLRTVYAAAKDAKRDALVITQTPHPSFVDVTDMVRLNDMLRLDDPGAPPRKANDRPCRSPREHPIGEASPPGRPLSPIVPQMRYRAAVAGAACPEVLIDTDDWTISDKATWREYVDAKLELGVPSLYYATHLDLTGEALEDDDYELLRLSWERWRAAL